MDTPTYAYLALAGAIVAALVVDLVLLRTRPASVGWERRRLEHRLDCARRGVHGPALGLAGRNAG